MSDGAVDHEYSEGEKPYAEQVADALAGVQRDPTPGGIAIDIVTRQPMFVKEKAADTLAEYYHEEGFDLLTYKMHPWLPGISVDDAAYTAVYLDGNPQNAHKPGKTYDFPAARLMHFPVEMAWDAYEVKSL